MNKNKKQRKIAKEKYEKGEIDFKEFVRLSWNLPKRKTTIKNNNTVKLFIADNKKTISKKIDDRMYWIHN